MSKASDETKQNKPGNRFIRIAATLLGFLFIGFGLVALFQNPAPDVRILQIPPEDSIKWFALGIIVLLLPYLQEFSFMGYSFKLWNEIREAKRSIDEIRQEIQHQKTRSREFLINAFSRYLKRLGEDERRSEVIKLNRIYFEEMGLDVSQVKKALRNAGYDIHDQSEEITTELIETLEKFQEDNNFDSQDGVFGYWTFEKLRIGF